MREQYLRDNIGFVVDTRQSIDRGALAAAMGVSRQAVGQLINGSTKTLKPINLVKAARRLMVPVERLVMEDLREVDGFGLRPLMSPGVAEADLVLSDGRLTYIAQVKQAGRLADHDLDLLHAFAKRLEKPAPVVPDDLPRGSERQRQIVALYQEAVEAGDREAMKVFERLMQMTAPGKRAIRKKQDRRGDAEG